MKNIQELISWAEVKRKAYSAMVKVFPNGKARFICEGRLAELDFFIRELNLLLTTATEASTEAAILQTHCKANVPPEVGTTNSGVLAADSSATRRVRQNAQAVKVCPKCGSKNLIMFTADDDICEDCGYY